MKNRAFRKFVASIGVAAMVMSTATNALSPAVTKAESAQELEGQQNDSQEQGGQEDPVAQSSDDANGAPFADVESMAVSSDDSQNSQEAAGPSESSDSNGENGAEGSSGENTNASAGSTSTDASGAESQGTAGTMSGATNGAAGTMNGTTNSTIPGTTGNAGTMSGATNGTSANGTSANTSTDAANGTSTDASTGMTTGENGEASGDNAEASTKEITSVITEDIDLGTYPAGEAPAYAQLELPDEIEVKVDEEKQIVTVTWNGEETYHPDQAGTYIFSSELDKEWNKDENGNARYQLAEKVELPKASVRVEKKAESKEENKTDVKSDNKTENKTDAKLDNKTDSKTDAKADNKKDSKTDAKADSKSEGKTEEKSDNKSEVTTKPETTKDTSKETAKDTSKENTKETSKKDSTSKDKTKDETKGETKDKTKDETKAETKTDTKDESAKADQKKVTNAASLKAVYVAEDGTILCGTVGLTGDSFTISDKAKSFNGYELKTVTLGEEELPQDTAFTRNTSTTETKEEIRTEASYTYTMDGAEHEIAAGDTATITFTYAQKEEVTPEIASIEVTGEAVDTTGAAIQGDYAFPLAVGTNDLSKMAPYIQGYEYQYAEIGTDKITSIDKEVLEAGKYAYYVDGELLKENTKITYVYQEDEDYTEQLTGTCGNLTVTVSAKKDAKIPEGTIVRVSPIESARMSQIMAKISETLGQDPDNVIGVLYDISLDKDGEEIQPKESVHVTMKFDGGIPWNVPEGKQIADTKVVHMHGGETDVVAEAAEDGNAEFETESFSMFGVYSITSQTNGSTATVSADLNQIVSSVTIKDKSGKVIANDSTVHSSEVYDFHIEIREDSQKQFSRDADELIYTLPEELTFSAKENGTFTIIATRADNSIFKLEENHYSYDQATGKLVVKLNKNSEYWDEFVTLNGARFSFDFKAKFTGNEGKKDIDFGNDVKKTVTVDTENSISVVKEGKYDPKNDVVNYTITVTSKGKNTNVQITDTVTGTILSYDDTTFKINDQEDTTHTIQNNGFQLIIPEMSNGETRKITYSAKINYDMMKGDTATVEETGNKVTVKSNEDSDEAPKITSNTDITKSKATDVSKEQLTKEPAADENGKVRVKWKVTANSKANISLNGMKIKDELSGDGADDIGVNSTKYNMTEPLRVSKYCKDVNGKMNWVSTEEIAWSKVGVLTGNEQSWTYNVCDTEKYQYIFEYSTITDVSDWNQNHKFNNKVSDGKENESSIPADVNIPDQQKSKFEKSHLAPTRDGVTWTLRFNVPARGYNNGCEITDTLPGNYVNGVWGYDELDGVIAADGTVSNEAIKISPELLPGESFEVKDVSSSNGRHAFKIIFHYTENGEKKNGLKASAENREYTLSVKTKFSEESKEPGDKEYSYTHKNEATMSINGDNLSDQDEVKVLPEREVVINKFTNFDVNSSTIVLSDPWLIINGTSTQINDACAFALKISGISEDDLDSEGKFTITDTASKYLKYVPADGYPKIASDSYGQYIVGTATLNSHQDNNRTISTITVTPGKQQDGTLYSDYYVIYYMQFDPTDDEKKQLNNEAMQNENHSVRISNKAEWNNISSNETGFDYSYAPLGSKTHANNDVFNDVTIKDADGKNIPNPNYHKVTFTIVVNPDGKKLNGENGYIELEDQMTVDPTGLASIDVQSIRTVPSNAYIDVQKPNENQPYYLFKLVDETPITLTYTVSYRGKEGENSTNVKLTNKASIIGYESTPVKDQADMTVSKGTGQISEYAINLYKSEKGKSSKPVKGATYQLFHKKTDDGEFAPVKDKNEKDVTFTTDEQGSIKVKGDQNKLGWVLWPDSPRDRNIYALKEIEAPEGYRLDSDYHIFKIKESPNGNDEYVNNDTLIVEDELKPKAQATLQVEKKITGTYDGTEKFNFVLAADEGNTDAPMPEESGRKVSVAKDGTGTFGTITYEETGTYYYVIRETDSKIPGMTYAEPSYAKVEVTKDDSGKLTAKVTYGATKEGATADSLTVTNTYVKPKAQATLKVTKAINGTYDGTEKFNFVLAADEGNTDAPMPEESGRSVLVAKDGTGTFGTITYEETGTYYYVIRETDSKIPGMTYAEPSYAKVEVTKDDSGKLTAKVTYGATKEGATADSLTVTNTYVKPKAQATLKVTKAINGTYDGTEKFNFVLAADEGNTDAPMPEESGRSVLVAKDGTGTFGTITYEETGTYYYVIRETDSKIPGMTYAEPSYAKVEVTKDDSGKLTAKVTYGATKEGATADSLTVTNTYVKPKAQATLKVTKAINGTYDGTEKFNFVLAADEGNTDAPMPEESGRSVLVAKDGTGTFGTITYEETGTYYYVIRETDSKIPGMTYAEPSYAKVEVTKDDSGKLTAKVTYGATKEGATADSLTVTNTYVKPKAQATLKVTKAINGTYDGTEKFNFVLAADEGNTDAPMPEESGRSVLVAKDGTGTFGTITYEETGTYYYVIRETDSKIPGMTYAEPSYAKVEVTKDDSGKLTAKVTYGATKEGATADSLTVTNTYVKPKAQATLKVTKAINGTYDGTEKFNFVLAADEGNTDAPMPEESGRSVLVAKDGTGTFGTITYEETGTYYYVIRETDSKIPGMTYAEPSYAKVEVTKDDSGKLTAKVTYGATKEGATADSLTVTNTYVKPKAQATLKVTKAINGTYDGTEKFNFVLAADEGNTDAPMPEESGRSVLVAKDGTGTFGTITYEETGTYYYVIRETDSKIPGMTYAEPSYAKVEVTKDDSGKLTAKVTYGATKEGATADSLTVTNTYVKPKAQATLKVTKAINGTYDGTEKFNFVLAADEGNTDAPMPEESGRSVLVAKDGTGTFGTITYEETGTYYYVIRETDSKIPGMTYAEPSYAKVEVTKDDSGKLTAKVTYGATKEGATADSLTVTNTYVKPKAQATLKVTKAINGTYDGTEKFNFVLAADEGNTDAPMPEESGRSVLVAKDGTGTFGTITYEETGTYYYVIRETDSKIPGMTYAEPSYAKVEVTKDDSGKLTAKVTYGATKEGATADSLTVMNTYVKPKAQATLKVTKAINGTYDGTEKFNFVLAADEGNTDAPMPEESGRSVLVAKDGTGTFGTITYEETGTYYYVIRETDSKIPGMTYAEPSYAKVEVTKDDSGKLTAKVTYGATKEGATADSLTVMNTYVKPKAQATLKVTKAINGTYDGTEKFNFVLAADEGNTDAPMPEESGRSVLVAKDGTGTFGTITYEETGTYYYVIRETDSKIPGMTYAEPSYAKVEVTKDDSGKLTAKVTYGATKEGATADSLTVTNTYVKPKAQATLKVTKAINGTYDGTEKFNFVLAADEGNTDAPMPEESGRSVLVAKDGTGTFGTITYEETGTYYYVIRETDSKIPGMTYAEPSYAKVEVTKDDSGKLTAKVTYGATKEGATADSLTVTNTYVKPKVSVTVLKSWSDDNNRDNKRPSSITVNLFADGTKVASQKITEANGWKYEFKDLPKYNNGTEIKYTITEDAVDGYTSSINGFNITNTYTPEKVQVSGSKNWNDDGNAAGTRPGSITIRLYANGSEIDHKTVTEKDGWSWNWTGLNRYDTDHKEISYTISEDAVDGYTSSISGYNVTNTVNKPQVGSVILTKVDATTGTALAGAVFDLYRANNTKVGTYTTNAGGVLRVDGLTFGDYYFVETKAPEGYALESQRAAFTINAATTVSAPASVRVTNKPVDEKIGVSAAKVWDDENNTDGVRPSSVTFRLFADGVEIGSAQASEANGWTVSFGNLPKTRNGAAISYAVKEDEVGNYYEASYETGLGSDGSYVFTVKNYRETDKHYEERTGSVRGANRNKPSNGGVAGAGRGRGTGDESDMTVYGTVSGASLLALIVWMIAKRKRAGKGTK